jgi:hypothetical protein
MSVVTADASHALSRCDTSSCFISLKAAQCATNTTVASVQELLHHVTVTCNHKCTRPYATLLRLMCSTQLSTAATAGQALHVHAQSQSTVLATTKTACAEQHTRHSRQQPSDTTATHACISLVQLACMMMCLDHSATDSGQAKSFRQLWPHWQQHCSTVPILAAHIRPHHMRLILINNRPHHSRCAVPYPGLEHSYLDKVWTMSCARMYLSASTNDPLPTSVASASISTLHMYQDVMVSSAMQVTTEYP